MELKKLEAAFLQVCKNQDEVNEHITKGWKHVEREWFRAIWTECGEAMGYLTWPWWKNISDRKFATEQERLDFYVELCDILHFGVSEMLARNPSITSTPSVAAKLAEHASFVLDRPGHTLVEEVEKVATEALVHYRFDTVSFFRACQLSGLGVVGVLAYYVGKNVLNHFRQENGYKERKYRKNWGTAAKPEEDNVHLAAIVENIRAIYSEDRILDKVISGDFAATVKHNLYMTYNNLEPLS